MRTNAETPDSAPAPGDLERDRKLEVLLDELVAVPGVDELPADFAARILERRPFAPWEVARASYWRVPAGVGLGLLAGSIGLALTPLWSLGPGTAFTVWGELLAVAFGRPVGALASALPLLAEATGRAAEAVPRDAVLVLGGAAATAAGSLGLVLARLRRPAVSAALRRG
jgi:hypothetical protein